MKKITENTSLIPGMFITRKNKREDIYRVIFCDRYMAERYRDGMVVCLDDNGHTVLIPAYDGNYAIISEGHEKMRIAYGKDINGEIKVSREYYFNEEDFRKLNPNKYFWYV